jgi:hypothetical protein
MARKLSIALFGHGFMGKAHRYACLATTFFFNTGIQPVRKVSRGRVEDAVKLAADRWIDIF